MNKVKSKNIVTVAVVTYHSAETVLETLDSIVNQSYGSENIELIVSDDGSKDDTVQVIEQWLSKYKAHFYDVKFFANKTNDGTSVNCNIAWRAATSEWIKTIAGDDVLYLTCIEDNMLFVGDSSNNYKINVVFSKMYLFKSIDCGEREYIKVIPSSNSLKFFSLPATEQYKYLQIQGIRGAPSAFIRRAALIEIGFADERFPLIEDHPLWFKFTLNGYVIDFMDKETVYYRITDGLSNSVNRLINERFVNEVFEMENKLFIPSLKKTQVILKIRKKIWPRVVILVAKTFSNRRTVISRLALNIALLIKPNYLSDLLNNRE